MLCSTLSSNMNTCSTEPRKLPASPVFLTAAWYSYWHWYQLAFSTWCRPTVALIALNLRGGNSEVPFTARIAWNLRWWWAVIGQRGVRILGVRWYRCGMHGVRMGRSLHQISHMTRKHDPYRSVRPPRNATLANHTPRIHLQMD